VSGVRQTLQDDPKASFRQSKHCMLKELKSIGGVQLQFPYMSRYRVD
jgi:hypothetical protein